jgi:capsular exopolysaccharide synthesis family protein
LAESLVPFYERSSLVTEQYRSLRTRLLSSNPNYEHRIIAITSAVPKEGKSVTTLNLGCILAEIRHLKVLVVDGDFRRSSLAHMLNQPSGPGLAEVLGGTATYEDVVRSTPIPNLSFIPAGSTNDRSAAELLTAASATSAFRRMQNEFHYTIVDTPPATTVTDVGIIGQMCTGVVMIVRLHRTHEAAAKRAVRLLQVNNIPIVGCLLVGRDSPTGGYYGYGYGYGYRYNYYRYYNYYTHKDGEADNGKK